MVLGLSSGNLLYVKALSLWAEKGFGEYVGIVLGPERGDRGWEWCQPSTGQLQARPALPILPLLSWLAETPGPLALGFTRSLTELPPSYFCLIPGLLAYFKCISPLPYFFISWYLQHLDQSLAHF